MSPAATVAPALAARTMPRAARPIRSGSRSVLVTHAERRIAARWVRAWRDVDRNRTHWPRLSLAEVRAMLVNRFA